MKFSVVAIVFQVILIILFATLVKYDPDEAGASSNTRQGENIRLYPSMCKAFYPYISGSVDYLYYYQ